MQTRRNCFLAFSATKESICSAYERVKQRAHEKNKNIQPSWASLMRVVATQYSAHSRSTADKHTQPPTRGGM